MKKEELIKKIEGRLEILKDCEKAFERIGDKKDAYTYFWQITELEGALELIKELED